MWTPDLICTILTVLVPHLYTVWPSHLFTRVTSRRRPMSDDLFIPCKAVRSHRGRPESRFLLVVLLALGRPRRLRGASVHGFKRSQQLVELAFEAAQVRLEVRGCLLPPADVSSGYLCLSHKGGRGGRRQGRYEDHTRSPPACAERDMGLSRRVSARPRHSASHDEEPAALVGGFEDGWPGRGGAVIRRRRRRV